MEKRAPSLRNLCNKALLAQEPLKAQVLFSQKKLPEDPVLPLMCEMAEKSSAEYIRTVMPCFETRYVPEMFFHVITLSDSAVRRKRIPEVWDVLSRDQRDKDTQILVAKMKENSDEVEEIVTCFEWEMSSKSLKDQIFYLTIGNKNASPLLSFLLTHDVSPDWWIDECFVRVEEGYFHQTLISNGDVLLPKERDVIQAYAEKNNLTALFARNEKNIARTLAFSRLLNEYRVGFHQLLSIKSNICYERYPTIKKLIGYLLNRISEKNAMWSFDYNYARFKRRLDGESYEQENGKISKKIWNFYGKYPRRIHISYIKNYLKNDERFCEDLLLYSHIINQTRNFYYALLKLIATFYPDEFEKCKEESIYPENNQILYSWDDFPLDEYEL